MSVWIRFAFIIATLAGWQTVAAGYRFETNLKKYKEGRTPGVAVLVMQHKKTLFKKAYGYSDIGTKKKIDVHTVFDMASVSKGFTAMAVAMLQEQGKLDVEDSLVKYFPEIGSYANEIKIRHLLNHTSGLPEYTVPLCAPDLSAKTLSIDDMMTFLRSKQTLDFKPGSRHEYSNTGFVFLSLIVEKVTNTPFAKFMDDQFSRLGMRDSFVMTPATEHNVIARPYSGWPFFNEHPFCACRFFTGDGGIYSSVDDLSKWIMAIEDNKLISATLKAKIRCPSHLDSGEAVDYSYGLGFDDDPKGRHWLLQEGVWLGTNTTLAYLPEADLWIAVLANHDGPRFYSRYIAFDIAEDILASASSSAKKEL